MGDTDDKEAAHQGVIQDPTLADGGPCASCHGDQTDLVETSLHYNIQGYKTVMAARGLDLEQPAAQEAFESHCSSCHATCGECHISRPNTAKGGFIDGHKFNKRPDQTNQCTACHGSRVGNEFTGETGQGDIHYTKHDMD